jgi:hypothetical protein
LVQQLARLLDSNNGQTSDLSSIPSGLHRKH